MKKRLDQSLLKIENDYKLVTFNTLRALPGLDNYIATSLKIMDNSLPKKFIHHSQNHSSNPSLRRKGAPLTFKL
jgi:hypothetical protein